jgi:transcriptional regulator with XRE-family HTH domain
MPELTDEEVSTTPVTQLQSESRTSTPTSTFSELTERAGYLHNNTRLLHSDTSALHLDTMMTEWAKRTSDLVRDDVPGLLGHLADYGFAWRDIAKMIGVSVAAVQKWRKGSAASGESRHNVAGLLAACQLIAEHYLVIDIAQWFESPVLRGYPITRVDLYAAGRVDQVFLLATGNGDPETVLSSFDPNWRTTYQSEFEIFDTPDGIALGMREH